jgi:hypothetical protein
MTDDSERALREKIDALVTKLPAGLVYSLLSEIEQMDAQSPDKVRMVRGYVIDYLNRQRPNRARRLFTSLFEAFLIDDEALYHAGQPIPYAVQRADVGALWDALSHEAFPLLAVQCQETLDMMTKAELLDRALRSPAAKELREQMRTATIRFVDHAFANRKVLEGFLAEMTRNRTRRSKLLSAHINRSPPFSADTLHGMRVILELAGEDAEDVAARLAAIPTAPPHDGEEAEAQADRIGDAAGALALLGPGENAAALFEASVLNVRQAYAPAGRLLRRREPEALRSDPLAVCLTGHFVGVARAFTAILMGVLRINDRSHGASIRPSNRDRARLDGLLVRLEQVVEAVGASGLRDDKLTEPQFHMAWDGAAKIINSRVAAVALERAAVAAAARKQGLIDQTDVVWLVGLVQRWRDVSVAFGLDAFDLVKWRETLMDEMRGCCDKAMRFEEGETLDERMEHLLRIDAICAVFRQPISGWIPASSHNMTKLVSHRLINAPVIGPAEQRLIEDVLSHVRDELKRSRYWKSNDLVEIIDMADKRFAASAPPPQPPATAGGGKKTAKK